MMADDLASIIAGCRAGDRRAQQRLYERYHRRLYALAARMVGPADAADVVQEIFLRVFARIGSFRGEAAFFSWLYRVAVNECLRHLRRRSTPLQPFTEEPVCGSPGPHRVLEQADLLERALQELKPPLRAVFWLREGEGLSYEQIAEVLEIAPGTVASQLSRARGVLQAFLRDVARD
jgi:RNA polymerase sigma-70 factor (ECF subfamily)